MLAIFARCTHALELTVVDKFAVMLSNRVVVTHVAVANWKVNQSFFEQQLKFVRVPWWIVHFTMCAFDFRVKVAFVKDKEDVSRKWTDDARAKQAILLLSKVVCTQRLRILEETEKCE